MVDDLAAWRGRPCQAEGENLMGRRRNPVTHIESVAATLRDGVRVRLLSPFNEKAPKGEELGYLTAMLYLSPHTSGGSKTLCPHSSEACRAACLAGAGRNALPRAMNAKFRRTKLYNEDRQRFLEILNIDLAFMHRIAGEHGMKLCVRLNGTSDVLWERETFSNGRSLMEIFPHTQFYDYTKVPLERRRVLPANYHLTFSLADDNLGHAIRYLKARQSIAAVVPEELKERLLAKNYFRAPGHATVYIDGDAHDLRFMDPEGCIVLLRPKGSITGSPLIRPNLEGDLLQAWEADLAVA